MEAGLLRHGRHHCRRGEEGAERVIAAAESLREHDEIGPRFGPVVRREKAPGAARAADDLVVDQQHAVAVADPPHLAVVEIGCAHRPAAQPDDGLHDEGEHRLRAFALNGVLECREAMPREAPPRRCPSGSAVAERRRHARRLAQVRLHDAGGEIAAERQRPERAAVVGRIAADDLPAAAPRRGPSRARARTGCTSPPPRSRWRRRRRDRVRDRPRPRVAPTARRSPRSRSSSDRRNTPCAA